MASIAKKLSSKVSDLFKESGMPEELGRVVVSDRPDLAQFQCNGALSAAKHAKKNPRDIANDLVLELQNFSEISDVNIAGPGFINMNIEDSFLESHLKELYSDPHLGVDPIAEEQVMVLDYGGPNVAKPMHVGHLRAAIIGDSLRRIAHYSGYKTLGDVHLGDWGTPMGMIISELEERHPEWVYFDKDYSGDYPQESPVSLDDLEEIYPSAAAACKENEARMDAARKATFELQDGRVGYRELWKQFVAVSIAAMKDNYSRLGVHFDLWKGEADVNDYIEPMVEGLKQKGFAYNSDGAKIVDVSLDTDTKEIPPLILYKSDGAVMYGTTDLATIVERVKLYNPSKIIYVVDQRQHLHFEQVFRAAKKSSIAPDDVELFHAGFGTMNGPDGRPFKTRSGGVLKLEDLISMGIEKALDRLNEADLARDMPEEERQDVAHKIAISAIKFADLQNQRHVDYVFDLDRLTRFEGKTGPYILYQAVRIKSLLKKASLEDKEISAGDFKITDSDRALALLLTQMPDYIELALRNYSPHHLCEYTYMLSQEFSSFYSACHILSEQDDDLRISRLMLCELTYKELEKLLYLLGIEIPDRM
jgi:arginyl-tRNA synthetase